MRHNDSVVARAYEVVCKILRSCALPSQAKANELLGDDFEVTLQAQPFQYFLDLSEQEQTGQLPQTDSIGNSAANPTALDSNLFQEQLLDPFLAYQPASTPYPRPEQIRMLILFWHSFRYECRTGCTSFKHAAPVVGSRAFGRHRDAALSTLPPTVTAGFRYGSHPGSTATIALGVDRDIITQYLFHFRSERIKITTILKYYSPRACAAQTLPTSLQPNVTDL